MARATVHLLPRDRLDPTLPTGLILGGMGGPDGADSVEPFLRNLFRDPAILPLPAPLACLVGRVIVRGNVRTHDNVVRRELTFSPGERFDTSKIKESVSNLDNSGLFYNPEALYTGVKPVRIRPLDTDDPGVSDIVVDVEEGMTGSVSLGGGFSSGSGAFASTPPRIQK